jgi:hypothetical protein
VDPYTLPNRANYYFTSNYDDAFHLNDDDRRYFVVEVGSSPMTTEEGTYYGGWIENRENRNALMWHLLHLDCSDFDPKGRAPDTDEKEEMKAANRPELDDWCLRLKRNPDDPDLLHPDCNDRGLPNEATVSQLLFAMQGRHPHAKYKPETMGRAMKRAGFEQKMVRVGSGSQRRYVIPRPKAPPKTSRRTRRSGAHSTDTEPKSPPEA